MDMSNIGLWRRDGELNGWTMPTAPWWKRLPIIRHLRAVRAAVEVETWYVYGPGRFGVRMGLDEWIVYGIWKGQEKA